MKKISFKEFISNHEIVSISDLEKIKKYGFCADDFSYDEKFTPCFLVFFKHGGFIELRKDGNFHLLVDRSDYLSQDFEKLVSIIFDFLEGEYFEHDLGELN